MKSFLILVLALLLYSFVSIEWKTVKLSETITVSMPGDPAEEMNNGRAIKKLKMANGTEFSAAANDLSSQGVTAEIIQQMIASGNLKEQIRNSIEAQGVKWLEESEGKYKNMNYFQYDIESNKNGEIKHSTIRSVFFESHAIQLIYTHGKEGKDETVRDQYFNSLDVK